MHTPSTLLAHYDTGALWPEPFAGNVAAGYAAALQVRALRQARGEAPRGYKIGFTNRGIWPRYNVAEPIWGTVWDTTLVHADSGQGVVALAGVCQPRIEPEAVFGLRATPMVGATLEDLFEAVDWVAPGFELVQSHMKGWKFSAADTVADGGLHAKLLIGARTPVRHFAGSAQELQAALASATVQLANGGAAVEQGVGANVLGDPLQALLHFLQTLRACPGAPDVQSGDVVTTGTWTDAWPVESGQVWSAQFSAPLAALSVRFT